MFRSLLAFLRLALARAHGGLAAAYGFLHDAFDEAVEPFTRRLPWLRDRAVDAGHGLAFGTLAAAQVPGAILREVGSVVGSFLPSPALTPQAVADHAVAIDDDNDVGGRIGGGGLLPNLHGVMVLHAAKALRDGGEAEFSRHVPHLAEPVVEWLRDLAPRDLAVACQLEPAVLQRHLLAERAADCSPLLPSFLRAVPASDPVLSRAEIEALCAGVRRRLAGQAREVEAMARRGVRPLAEPVWDDEPTWSPQPALH